MNEWWRNQNHCDIWCRRLSIGLQQCWVRVQHGDTQSNKFKLGSHNREISGERFDYNTASSWKCLWKQAMVCKVNNLQWKETCDECNYGHHVEPRVQLCVPKRRTIPKTTEMHWRVQNYTHKFGRVARKPHRRSLERRCGSKFVRLMHSIHEVHNIEWKISKRVFVVRRLAQIRATARPEKMWPEIWSGMSKAAQRKEKAAMGCRGTDARQCARLRCIFYPSGRYGVQSNHEKTCGEVGSAYGSSCASWGHEPPVHGNLWASPALANRSMHASWKAHESTRKRFRNELCQKITKIALQGRGLIHQVITILCTSSFLCPKQWKYLGALLTGPPAWWSQGDGRPQGLGPEYPVSTLRPARVRVGQSQHCRDQAAKLLPDCMMGSAARNFSRTKSVESSSEIGWQRSYRILALKGPQADKQKLLNKEVDLGEPTSFLDHVYWGCTQKTMWNKQRHRGQLQNHVWIANFSGENRKASILWESSFLFMVLWYGGVMQKKCVERYCELANKTTQQLYKVSTPCIDDHHFKEEEMISLLENCQKYALKLFWNVDTWHELEDLIFYGPWTKLTRSITKKNQSLWQTIMSIDFIHSSHMWT